jgi:hypothetical protein
VGSLQAHPFHVEFGVGLTRSAPLGLEKEGHIKGALTLEHRLDRPAQLMRQNAQRFTLIMLFLQTSEKLLTFRISAEEQGGGFGKGPLKVRIADFVAGSPQTFASGFLAPFDQAGLRGEVLHSGKTADVMDFIKESQAQDFSNTGHRLQPVEGVGIVLLGRVEDREFEVFEQLIIVGDQSQVDLDGLLHGCFLKACASDRHA